MIVHVSPSYKPATPYGGTTASISILCEALSNYGYEIRVLTTTANGQTELNVLPNTITLVNGVKVRYCRRLSKDPTHFSISLLYHLWRIIRDEPMVVVHIHSWWNLTAIFSLLMTKYFGVPTVLSPRGMLTDYTFRNKNSRLKKCFHKVAGKHLLKHPVFHATSKKEEQDIIGYVKRQPVTVIHNLIRFPGNIQRNEDYCADNGLQLLFLSRIQEKKGLELLFEALKMLHFPWQLTIAGAGHPQYISKLKDHANQLGIAASISWIGHLNDESKYQCLANHDLLVLPSHNENFGNVVLESLLSGTPVLISKEVGLSGYIQQNKLGWIASLDCESFAEQLIKAMQQTDRRLYIRRTAPTQVCDDFNVSELVHQYLQLYENCVQS